MSSELRDAWEKAGGSAPTHWDFVRFEDLLADSKAIAVGVMYPGKHEISGIPLIKVSDVKNGAVVDEPDFCIEESVNHEYRRTMLHGNELLITLVGNPGDCAIVDESMSGWNVARALAVVRLKDPSLRAWLRYVLLSNAAKHLISARLNTTVQKTLNLKDIRSLPIPIAPRGEINSIVESTSAIENKINTNHQINQTLEQMAQALFKSWFVDFEPVKAKIAARARWQALQPDNESASPACYAAEFDERPAVDDLETTMNRAAMQAIAGKTAAQLDALREEDPERYHELYETAALFSSMMQESELGKIPEGWEITTFDKFAKLDSSSIKPSNNPEKIWEHYSIPAFDAGKAPALDAGISIKSGKYKVKKTSVLISKLNPSTSRVWWPEPLDNESAICSTEFMQFVPRSDNLRAFIAGMVSSAPFQAGVIASVTGSTGSRQRAQPKQVAKMDVVVPCEALALRYARQAQPLFTAQAKNISQSQKLAELRDTLLPKLLSGELTPSEVEEAHAEATA